jgi:stress-induced morphogen
MITPDVLTEYVRKMMPDAVVTVSDRTGTMDHLKVVVVSAAFAGKNLLDRHRLVYQLDVPMKDGRIHAPKLLLNNRRFRGRPMADPFKTKSTRKSPRTRF